MDISGSMSDVINNYIKTIIPNNLNYQTKTLTLIKFANESNVYNYKSERFKSSDIIAFTNLNSYLSNFQKKII